MNTAKARILDTAPHPSSAIEHESFLNGIDPHTFKNDAITLYNLLSPEYLSPFSKVADANGMTLLQEISDGILRRIEIVPWEDNIAITELNIALPSVPGQAISFEAIAVKGRHPKRNDVFYQLNEEHPLPPFFFDLKMSFVPTGGRPLTSQEYGKFAAYNNLVTRRLAEERAKVEAKTEQLEADRASLVTGNTKQKTLGARLLARISRNS